MNDDEEPMEKIEFSFPILMPVGKKVRVNKNKVDQTYFECPIYIMEAEEGEVIGHPVWTNSSKVVLVKFTKMSKASGAHPCSYNLPNSYLELVK